jgi:prolipoprotein diacylglyceryltransferase
VGKRVPVPLIQGIEDSILWLALLGLEHLRPLRRVGVITGVAMIVWGLVRSLDERLLLGQESHSGSIGVQIAGLVLALAGAVLLVRQLRVGCSTPDPSVDPHAPVTRSERR